MLGNRFVGEIKLIKYIYGATKKPQILNTILTKSGLKAIINQKGAELISLKNASGKEYIWDGNPEFWGKHSPVLFPIVGTLKNNHYRYNDKTYTLPRHGFARDLDFDIASQSENEVVFSLQSSAETNLVYPFDFELQIIYTLHENGLTIGYKIFNKNNTEIPFAIGAHPAFALPGNFEDYAIEMEKPEILKFHLLENDLISETTGNITLSERKFPLNYELFKNDALVFKTMQSRALTILQNGNPVVKISFDDFPNLGIWTKEKAPFLCIEPWFGYADTIHSNGNLFKKEGIQVLQPNQHFKAAFDIEIF